MPQERGLHPGWRNSRKGGPHLERLTAPPQPEAQRSQASWVKSRFFFFHGNTCFHHGKRTDQKAGAGQVARSRAWNHVSAMEGPVATLPAIILGFFSFVLGSTLQA